MKKVTSYLIKCIIILIGTALTASAFAQVPPPVARTQMPSDYKNFFSSGDGDAREDVQRYDQLMKFSKCVTNISSKGAQKMLETSPNSRDEARKFFVANDRYAACKAGNMTIAQSLKRGSMAEAFVAKKAKKWEPAPILPDSAEYQSFIQNEIPFNSGREDNDKVMISATNCMVAQQPVLALAILRSEHGTDQEAAMMNDIFTSAPTCAGTNRPQDLNPSFLRAFLAQSLYRLWLHNSDKE